MRPQTRRADHTLLRSIYVVAGRIVSNPAFNNQAHTGAAEVKCRHAETLRASSDRRFDALSSAFLSRRDGSDRGSTGGGHEKSSARPAGAAKSSILIFVTDCPNLLPDSVR